MRTISKIILLIILCFIVMVLAVGIGSVYVNPIDSLNIVFKNITGHSFLGEIDSIEAAIIWDIRLPRTLLAFVVGAGLSLCGVIMQCVLRNPLASSYTLGVSAGAAVGASIVIILGVSFLGTFTLPIVGLLFSLLSIFIVLGIAAKFDRSMQNNSVILTGMAISLFFNSIITIIISVSGDSLQRLIFWQMGSFAAGGTDYPLILFPIVAIGAAIAIVMSKQMDILSLGDEQANVTGVRVTRLKTSLLILSSFIAGAIVSLVGIIGFVDLFIPHATRKIFGSKHKNLVIGSLLMGGAFMVICDLISRTIIAPTQLPIGAITSVVGGPFFIYLYFSKGRKASDRN